MRICILTSRHISYNPRVVKEADAWDEAGHDVSVATVRNFLAHQELDEEMMQERHWSLYQADYCRDSYRGSIRWFFSGLYQRIFQHLNFLTMHFGVAERAQSREFPLLKRLVKKQKADLYSVHHAENLALGYSIARKNKALFAFDAEDFHSGQFEPGKDERQRKRIEFLEGKYLKQCDVITAASPGIAKALQHKYALTHEPVSILNTFPLEDIAVASQNLERPLSLFWYSQVIGPGRGLEELFEALADTKITFEVHLLGRAINEFIDHLKSLSESNDFTSTLTIHPSVPPNEIIAFASRFDIGLTLETLDEPHHNLCLGNKIFAYLNAGLAIVASDTVAQRAFMEQVPDAGYVCDISKADIFCQTLEKIHHDRDKLYAMKKAARQVAEDRFNWEREKKKLLNLLHVPLKIKLPSDGEFDKPHVFENRLNNIEKLSL